MGADCGWLSGRVWNRTSFRNRLRCELVVRCWWVALSVGLGAFLACHVPIRVITGNFHCSVIDLMFFMSRFAF